MTITEIIRKRRSIFPKTYLDKPIPKEIIEEILENANHAPNHRKTEPWRFRIIQGEARQAMSDFMGAWYKKSFQGERFSETKYQKMQQKPLQSACIIAICMQRDPEARIPEWEEIAAVACAVQNMWLTCTAYGIGSYWSSPSAIRETSDWLRLQEGERCLGFFYMGYHELPELPAQRKPIEEKIIWM